MYCVLRYKDVRNFTIYIDILFIKSSTALQFGVWVIKIFRVILERVVGCPLSDVKGNRIE